MSLGDFQILAFAKFSFISFPLSVERAFKRSVSVSQQLQLQKSEFPSLLKNVVLYNRVLQLIKLTDANKIDVLDLKEFARLLQYVKSPNCLEGNADIRDPKIHTKTLETFVSVQKIALADSDGESDTGSTDELRDKIQARSGNQKYISPAPALLADDSTDDEIISAGEQDVDSDEEAPELFIPAPEQLSLERELMREQQACLNEICAEFEKHMKHRVDTHKRTFGTCLNFKYITYSCYDYYKDIIDQNTSIC
jgi:hypothetical protein